MQSSLMYVSLAFFVVTFLTSLSITNENDGLKRRLAEATKPLPTPPVARIPLAYTDDEIELAADELNIEESIWGPEVANWTMEQCRAERDKWLEHPASLRQLAFDRLKKRGEK